MSEHAPIMRAAEFLADGGCIQNFETPFDIVIKTAQARGFKAASVEELWGQEPRLQFVTQESDGIRSYMDRLRQHPHTKARDHIYGMFEPGPGGGVLGLFSKASVHEPLAIAGFDCRVDSPCEDTAGYSVSLVIKSILQTPWNKNLLHAYVLARAMPIVLTEPFYPHEHFEAYNDERDAVIATVRGKANDTIEYVLMIEAADVFHSLTELVWNKYPGGVAKETEILVDSIPSRLH